MLSFEFAAAKSRANLARHGIDLMQAQRIRDDPDFVGVNAKSVDEPRALVIGRVDRKYWSAVITYRDGNIRLISARRSRQTEVALYES